MPNLLDIKKEKHSYKFKVADRNYEVTLTGRVYIDGIEADTSIDSSSYICFRIEDKLVRVSDILFQCADWLRRTGDKEVYKNARFTKYDRYM